MTANLLLLLLTALGQVSEPAPSAEDIIRRSAPGEASPALPGEQPDDGVVTTGAKVLASINGQAITAADLANYVRQRAGPGAEVTPEMLHEVRRQVAQQILLSSQAALDGIELSDGDVERYWENYVGDVPDFQQLARDTGTTAKRQRELARRAVLAEIYTYHKVGLWSEFAAAVEPDPLLQKLVDVTPGEMRELFLAQPEMFEVPAGVAYEAYPTYAHDEAETIRRTLVSGARPADRRPIQESVMLADLPRAFSYSEALIRFLQLAPVDTVSQVFDAPMDQGSKGYVVFLVTDRQEGRQPDFREVQDELRRFLTLNRVDVARKTLVETLVPQAFYWPQDLFQESMAQAGAAQR